MLMKSMAGVLLVVSLAACSSLAEESAETSDTAQSEADAATEGESENAADAETAAWLVGSWVIRGEHCQSDLGLNFHADGTYSVYEETGDWEVTGDELRLTPREIFEMGEPTPSQAIENPETEVQTIVARDADSYTTRFADEETLEMVRCPSYE
jgi:hypothetical protein